MFKSRIASIFCLLTVAVLLPGAARAQLSYLYGVNAFVGIGGSSDATPEAGFSNSTYQLGFNLSTEPRGRLGVRFGKLDLDDEGQFGDLFEADLTYLTVGGEYRYRASFYDSGLYVGLGGYKLAGRDISDNSSADETNLGLALGLTGEFAINRRWAVVVELSGHWVDFDKSHVFGMGHVGLGYSF